jgi:DNA-binding FadR family transcriptional regulator
VFRSLMAKRLIEMKRYRGAFVAPRNQWNYLDTDVCSGYWKTITTRGLSAR